MSRIAVLALLAGASGVAQEVLVYSEFQRVDPFGNVVAADHTEQPREILSPALARNAFASFQIVLSFPTDRPHHLFIGQNPENAVDVKLYKVAFTHIGDTWFPDALDALKLTPEGLVPDVPWQVPGQKISEYWLDVWVKPDAPVRRTRLEIQLNADNRWIIYPLELRILSPVIPRNSAPLETLAAVDAPASASASAVLRAWACGGPAKGEEGPLSVRRLIRRNARQDAALARALQPSQPTLLFGLLETLGAGDRDVWCANPSGPRELGAEWYHKVRDYLYRVAVNPPPKPTITVAPVK